MLQLLLHIIIISFTCMIWGIPVLIWQNKKPDNYWYDQGLSIIIFLFFAGLLSLSVISSWLSLFMPLTFIRLLVMTVALAVIIIIFYRRSLIHIRKQLTSSFNLSFSIFFFLSTCLLLCLTMGTLKPVNGDTQLYHLQIIRWTNEFGTVPGLANLYPRLGLGSPWFNLISFFYIPGFRYQNFTFLNTTLTLWFIMWLTERWNYFTYQKKSFSYSHIFSFLFFLLIAYSLFDWQLIRDTANSTSYDFIVTSLSLFCIFYLTAQCFTKGKKTFSLIFVLLSISIISFKLSGLSILILIFIYLLNYQRIIPWAKSILAGCIILLPVLIKNHIITGYPLYPLPVSINTPEWQVPGEITLKIQNYIYSANKFYNHQQSFIEAFNQTTGIKTFNWIPFWFRGILIKHKILFFFSGLSLLLLFFPPAFIIKRSKFRLLLAGLWSMAIVWFFLAPDPRFAFGFLLFLAFFPISVFSGDYIGPKLYRSFFYLLSLCTLVYVYSKINKIKQEPDLLLHTTTIDTPPYKKSNRNGISFHEVERINNNWDKRCFFAPLPCLPEINPYVIPRSNKLKNGFKMAMKPDSAFIRNYNY